MPLSYDEFQNIRKSNPDLYNKRILPQLDYFEAVLAEAINTLNQGRPRDEDHVSEVEAMRKAIHDFAHPGRFTWPSTTAANMATVCTLRDFLEKNDGRNYKLVKQTMDAHNAYLKNGKSEEKQEPSAADLLRELNEELSGKSQVKPQAKSQEPFEQLTQQKNKLSAEDRGKNLNGHLSELNNFFGLQYEKRLAEYYRQELREQFQQKLAQNRERFKAQTAKQMRFLEEVLKDAAEDIDPMNLQVSHFALQMSARKTRSSKNSSRRIPPRTARLLPMIRRTPPGLSPRPRVRRIPPPGGSSSFAARRSSTRSRRARKR